MCIRDRSVTDPKDKVMYGTKNMAMEPAMSREQAAQAVLIGIRKVKELAEQGYDLIATGEMGIGNTTTSSAVAVSYTHLCLMRKKRYFRANCTR